MNSEFSFSPTRKTPVNNFTEASIEVSKMGENDHSNQEIVVSNTNSEQPSNPEKDIVPVEQSDSLVNINDRPLSIYSSPRQNSLQPCNLV